MTSIPPPTPPFDAALQSLKDELDGKVSRNVDGFFDKYFKNKPWYAAVENTLHDPRSAQVVGKLAVHPDPVGEWLTRFQTLFPAVAEANLHFRTHPLTRGAVIYLEPSDSPSAAGSTRVFGEIHDGEPGDVTNDEDGILHFYARARQIFKDQSARCFVHGFLLRGKTLELWIFDRSGAYSSEILDSAQSPDLLVRLLAGYTAMSDEEVGFNTFVKRPAPGSTSYITFQQADQFYLRPELIATADSIVGPGTTCYTASTTATADADTVIKFCWREEEEATEVRILERARERNAFGVIQLAGYQDLVSTAELRQGLHFAEPFVNRRLSCIATTPLGRPIRQFASIPELLEALRDIVRALQSLYEKAGILHRDVAIKNLIIPLKKQQQQQDNPQALPKGILIDLNFALELEHACPVEPMVGSDGFMSIGTLFGQRHTYRHDLESVFYVFLWLAITNDRAHDETEEILKVLRPSSRLHKWVSMNFVAVGLDKADAMSEEGFETILAEFDAEFASLKGLATELWQLLYPVRDGKICTQTDTDPDAAQTLYNGMAEAFDRSARAF